VAATAASVQGRDSARPALLDVQELFEKISLLTD
jgi:hypothetical protein